MNVSGWDGLTLANPAALSLPLLSSAGEEKGGESLWLTVKSGRSLADYHHRLNILDVGKFNLIYCQLK